MALSRTDRGNTQAAYAGQSDGWALTSASFSPAAGALLIALWAEATTTATPDITMSTTLSGQGSWTEYGLATDDGFGNLIHSRIAWSVCGGSPGSGTVTATTNGTGATAGGMLTVIEVTGQDTVTPVRQNDTTTNDGSAGTLDLNFASSVQSTSFIFAVGNMHGSDGSITVPSGHTKIDQMVTGSWAPTFSEDVTTPGAQNNQFGGGSTGGPNTGVIIEVAEATAQAYMKLWGGVPFALGGTKGRW